MDALGLVGTVAGHRVLNVAGLILLGRNEVLKERIPTHSAQFQAFAPDGSLPVNLTTGDPGLPHNCLLYLAVRIEELLRGLVPRREMMDGLFRIDIPAYGDDALREAVMNAFIHRDYICPEPVIIQITPQHCTITNPGGFYRDVTPDNILFHEPCPRNQCLAHACVHLNLMERSGRGVDRIFWDQIRFLRPMPSYRDSTAETVRLNLVGGEGTLESIRWMIEYFAEKDLRIRVVHGGLVNVLLSEGESTRQGLITALPGLDESLGRRAITELINAGLIHRIGHGRGQRMVISPQFLKSLGTPEAFVHQAGLDEARMKQMVLQYVDSHGTISRSEAARLLGVNPDNSVYRLLDNLAKDSQLARVGQRSQARYIRPKV
jgi:ATP-dependent DNA helicase RecG